MELLVQSVPITSKVGGRRGPMVDGTTCTIRAYHHLKWVGRRGPMVDGTTCAIRAYHHLKWGAVVDLW